jgi:dCMP deaminase
VRIDKTNYYLDIAEAVAQRGTCLRRNYGAIIVKNDEIISTGYTGAARGVENCSDIGTCARTELNIPSGERYELCRSVHAEQNAIISASRKDMIGSTLYLVGRTVNSEHYVQDTKPCLLCQRFILNAGIEKVIVRVSESVWMAL